MTRMSRAEATELLEVSPGRLRSLAREHPQGLGGLFDTRPASATYMTFTYDRGMVTRLARQRGNTPVVGRFTKAEAAAVLGVGQDRFNQLVREDPNRLGRERNARGRSTYCRVAVEALKRRREGKGAPVYPRRGSAHTGQTRGSQ